LAADWDLAVSGRIPLSRLDVYPAAAILGEAVSVREEGVTLDAGR